MNWLKFLPYISGFAVVMAVAAWIYDTGYASAENKCRAEKVAAIERAIEQAEEQRKIDLEIAEESQKVAIKTKIVYKAIHDEAEHIESKCADVGDDFVRVYRNAIEAASSSPSAE